ncbi:MAG: metallophosphoesterase family protein [Bacteroidales bacterium]|nr:metallophosphoesterase family protein [Bacteroidales bacterium]
MQKIGLLSDTHTWIYPGIYDFFKDCDELWHAGDIGNEETLNTLEKFKPLRAVHGNIDGYDIRIRCPETMIFHCENLKVMIRHIGGYPGKYDRRAAAMLDQEKPGLFISGHSHILKVIYDEKRKLLHLNPGAAGRSGLHRLITCMRFNIDGEKISELEILEKPRNEI